MLGALIENARCPLCGAGLRLLPDSPHATAPSYRCETGHFTHTFATERQRFDKLEPAPVTIYEKP